MITQKDIFDIKEDFPIYYMCSAIGNICAYFGSHIIGHALQNTTLENNIGDIFLSAAAYCTGREILTKNVSLLGSITSASTLEFLQRFGQKGYDPKDFLAYGLGAGLAYTIDMLIAKREK